MSSDVDRILRSLRKFFIAVCVIGLVLLAVVWWVGYEGRRAICQRDVQDRASDIVVRVTQAWADQRIADDGFQSVRTRETRGLQAAIERASAHGRLTRIDEGAARMVYATVPAQAEAVLRRVDGGERLSCTRASLLP